MERNPNSNKHRNELFNSLKKVNMYTPKLSYHGKSKRTQGLRYYDDRRMLNNILLK